MEERYPGLALSRHQTSVLPLKLSTSQPVKVARKQYFYMKSCMLSSSLLLPSLCLRLTDTTHTPATILLLSKANGSLKIPNQLTNNHRPATSLLYSTIMAPTTRAPSKRRGPPPPAPLTP